MHSIRYFLIDMGSIFCASFMLVLSLLQSALSTLSTQLTWLDYPHTGAALHTGALTIGGTDKSLKDTASIDFLHMIKMSAIIAMLNGLS